MKKLSRLGSDISVQIGKAIGDYDLIRDDDKILVGVSGGKDSVTLLKLLKERQRWAPVHYELYAVTIKTDFSCASCIHSDLLERFYNDLEMAYEFKAISVLNEEKKTDCFWCSWNRRKALFDIAQERGCNKLALGHHKDDIVETTLLNLFFKGEFATMNPLQELFNGALTIIRPLCYVEETATARYAEECGFPAKSCACPFGRDSERRYMKELLLAIQEKSPAMNIKSNIMRSMARIKTKYLDIKESGSEC